MDLSTIRNIGIAAHIDAGKTTTTERILFYTRRTHRMGEVDDGTTLTDFDEQEQQRGITIYSAAVSCPWRGCTINLIDTPGHVDFTAEVERSLRVLDGAVAIFDAKEGVEPQSETVWNQCEKYAVPRLCFINKMDKIGADFERAFESIRERLQRARPLALQIPIGAGPNFQGLIDLVSMRAVFYQPEELGSKFRECDIPVPLREEAQRRRHDLEEAVAETSDHLTERYLADHSFTESEILSAIRQATLKGAIHPVLCGSALRYVGVQRMLDAVCDYLPNPLELKPVVAKDANRPHVEHLLPTDPDGPLAALVFKVVAEKPMDLYYLRIYSGTLRAGTRVLNASTGRKENVTRIYRMFARRRDHVDRACAGDIVAVVGLRNSSTGHTLCETRRPLTLETIEFPETVISISVEPRSSKDRDKLGEALRALERQDPTVLVTTSPETGQTLISGMGELHLEVLVERLKREMSVEVNVGSPRVSYRETVSGVGEGQGRFVRQIGGRRHFAVVRVRVEPCGHRSKVQGQKSEGRKALDFRPWTFDLGPSTCASNISADYRAAIKAGIKEAAQSGVLGGYPTIDWKATLLDAVQHDTDSSEVAFENAGRLAFEQAVQAAGPVLLEPIMSVEVVTPNEYFGAIINDLNGRRAIIHHTQTRGGDRVIQATAPLREMFGYITRLRTLSRGRATSAMTPARYAPVPADEARQLVG